MANYVLNGTDHEYLFPIIDAAGNKDKVYCGPGSKASLPDGSQPDPDFAIPLGIRFLPPGPQNPS